MGDWCLIDSDPAVFTELIHSFGAHDVDVDELYSLDMADTLDPCYGLIFLFNYSKDTHHATQPPSNHPVDHVYFAKQVIQNACATQAILNILLNTTSLDLGSALDEFRSFTKELPPDMRGLAMSNSDLIRNVHNSFARSVAFYQDPENDTRPQEDAFHFIAYVPVNGFLYELDGLQPQPIPLGPCENRWTVDVKQYIEKRIHSFSEKEIRFNLMALLPSRRIQYQSQLDSLRASFSTMDDGLRREMQHQVSELEGLVAEEERKLATYKKENQARRHNFVPLILEMLQCLAELNQLPK